MYRRGLRFLAFLAFGLCFWGKAQAEIPPVVATLTVVSDDPSGDFVPGAPLTYVLTVTNPGDTIIGPLEIAADLPPEVSVTRVLGAPAGTTLSLGARRLDLRDALVPAHGRLVLTLLGEVQPVDAMLALGHPFVTLDGLSIALQAQVGVQDSPLPGTLGTDDPATGAPDDPTAFTLRAFIDLRASRKSLAMPPGGLTHPGDTLTYTLTLENRGNVDAVVDVSDPLPAGLTGCALAAPVVGLACAGDTLAGSVTLPAGGVLAVTLIAQVAADAAHGLALRNTASAAPQLDPGGAVSLQSQAVRVFAAPVLEVTKTAVNAPNGTIEVGQTFVYQIDVHNSGNRDATALNVSDDLVLPGTVVAESLDGGAGNGGHFEWQADRLAPGADLVFRLRVTVGPNTVLPLSISNQAVATATELLRPVPSDDPALPGASDPTVVEVTPARPNFRVTKTVHTVGPGVPEAGASVAYDLTVTSDRAVNLATAPVLHDVLPATLGIIDAGGAADLGNGTLDFTLPVVWQAGVPVRWHIVAEIVAGTPAGTTISNQAHLRRDGETDVASDDPDTGPVGDSTVLTVVASPVALTLSKTAQDVNGGDLLPGDAVVYTLTVVNTGPVVAAGAILSDGPPPGVVLDGSDFGDPNNVRMAIGTLLPIPPGGRVVAHVFCHLAPDVALGSRLFNAANLDVGLGGPHFNSDDPTTPLVDDPTLITVAAALPAAVVVAEKVLVPPADGVLSPGDTAEYTLTLRNDGQVATAPLEVVDPLDPNLTAAAAAGGRLSADGRTATWLVDPLVPGASVRLTLTAQIAAGVPPGTRITNQYGVRPAGTQRLQRSDDPTVGGAEDPVAFLVGAAMVGVPHVVCTKTWSTAMGAAPAAGEVVNYEIACRNDGNAVAPSPLTLVDVLPAALTYVARSTTLQGRAVADRGGAPFAAPGLDLAPVGLPPGDAVVLDFSARVGGAVRAGLPVSNQGALRLADGTRLATDDPNTPAGPDPTTFAVRAPVGSPPDLSAFSKTATVVSTGAHDRAAIGDTVEWTLTATNGGGSDANNVTVVDPLPGTAAYVPGTLVVNGAPLTDAVDGDAAEVQGGQLSVHSLSLRAGDAVRVTFRTRVIAGPLVQNQARISANGLRPEPSDNNGDESDGNLPTVVSVGAPVVRSLTLKKSAVPEFGGVNVGYTLVATNTGTADLNGIVVTDSLPSDLTVAGSPAAPAGIVVDASPRAVRFSSISLAPGAQVTLKLRATLGPRPAQGSQVCNQADATASGIEPVRSEPACIVVDRARSALFGHVFQEAGGNIGFQAGRDVALADMHVVATPEDGSLPPMETRSGSDGAYRLNDLPLGHWEVTLESASGTFMGQFSEELNAPGGVPQDLAAEPGGRVYDSRTGTPVDGAQVFLYRVDGPLGESADPFDPALAPRLSLVPGANLESPSEQGQTTSNGGLYRFLPTRPGTYLIQVQPATSSLVYPSLLRPAQAGVLQSAAGPVEPSILPPTDVNTTARWYPLFRADGATTFSNNHLPLDPLSSLIEIEKRSLKGTATTGEIVTYEIDVVNRSHTRLTYDPSTNRGGIFIEDTLPNGFRYVAGSAALMRVGTRAEHNLMADDPTGATTLRFGHVETENGRNILRPLDLDAGQHLRLRYQLVVGANTRPRETYRNHARVLSDIGAPLTGEATADVLVTEDPDLDLGLLIGKVFCDADRNGEQGQGESGLPGVVLMSDTGQFAVTDSAGKFHFDGLPSGTHAFKLDTDSLLPGGEMTTDETRTLSFTRGLPAKVAYGVTCPSQTVDRPQLQLGAAGLTAALAQLKQRYVVITGNVRALRLTADGREEHAQAPHVSLVVDGAVSEAPDLKPGGDGTLADLAFDTRVPAGAPGGRWSLWLGALGGDEAPIAQGQGPVPARILWDQRGDDGTPVLHKGQTYAYRLEVSDLEGRTWGSPAGVFGIGARGEPEPPLVAAVRGSLFTAGSPTPDPLLERELRKLLPKLKKIEGDLRLEVHGDDALPPDAMRAATQAQAEAAAVILRGLLGGARNRVLPAGMGADRPLAPNLSDRQRQRNRRLEIRQASGAGAGGARTVDLRADYSPCARAGRDEAFADDHGEFALTAEVPDDGVVEVALRDVDGSRAVFPVRMHPGAPADLGAPRVVALSGAPPAALTLGGAPLSLPALDLKVIPPARWPTDAAGKPLSAPVALRSPQAAVAEWGLSLMGPDGGSVFSQGGQGTPPESVLVAPVAGAWRGGRQTARLTVRLAGGGLLQSPPAFTQPGTSAPAGLAPGAWEVFLDGRALAHDPTGRFFGETTVRGSAAVLLELGSPDGARLLKFVTPPGRADAMAALDAPRSPRAPDAPGTLSPDGPVGAAFVGVPPPMVPPGLEPEGEPLTPAPATGPGGDPAAPAAASVALVPAAGSIGPYRRIDDLGGPPAPAGGYHRVDELDAAGVATAPAGPANPAGAPAGTYRRIDELTANKETSANAPSAEALRLHPYVPVGGGRAAFPAPPPARNPMSDPAREAIAAFGRAELLRLLTPAGPLVDTPPGGPEARSSIAADVPAAHLSVELPATDAILAGRTVPVRGVTAPENRIFVNGVELPVSDEGRFGGAALLNGATNEIEVVAQDPDGNRGIIRRAVKPADAQWFLLALGEGATGPSGTELDGVTSDTSVQLGDAAWLHGRGVVWLKGRAQGRVPGNEILGGLFDEYEVNVNVDTARRRALEPAFRELIDPNRDYPAYGDSGPVTDDVHSRGPLYVLVQADQSQLVVGDFKSDVQGLELFRYDRSLYGARLKLDKAVVGADGAERWHHETSAFVADLDAPERHAYVEMRGTGGSLYYLPYEELVEGSEKVYLVERDAETGIERRRQMLVRDEDYTIRYREGRILMKSPVPRVTLDGFGAAPLARNGARSEVLSGHPVYLAVEMDHRDPKSSGDVALGVYARETYAQTLTLGGGYVQEGRSTQGGIEDSATRYRLWGGQIGLRHGRRTQLEAEWVQSRNALGTSLFSDDGGLTFEPFHKRDGSQARGTGLLLRGGLELDDLIGTGQKDRWYTEGYYQSLGAGFSSGGTLQDQGLEKYGVSTRYFLTEHHSLRLQYDAVAAENPATQGDEVFHGYHRAVTRIGHTYEGPTLKLDTDLVHTLDDEGLEEPAFKTDALEVGAEYKLTPKWTLLGGQEVILRGDSRLQQTTSDLFATTAGARYKPVADVAIEGSETVRFSGDNATQLGVRTDVDDRHTVYVNERYAEQQGRSGVTSVVGGEERWGEDKSGRSYGEYQLEAGELGARNRAVLGLGKKTRVVKNLTIDASYERSQVLAGPEDGALSSDTVSLGSEWLDHKRVKIAGRYEMRYDDNSERVGKRDALQFLTLNGVDWLVTPDVTLLLRLNYSQTYDLGFQATNASLAEGSIGLAFRPIAYDWLAVILKYTKRFEQRPTDLLVELPIRDEVDVVSAIPMFELPWHFQLVEKVAYKRMATRTLNLPTVVSDTELWINRLNYHLTHTWDAGAEYRVLTTTLARNTRKGALCELDYILKKAIRLGVGYNFTSFSDDEFERLNEAHGGPFFRVVAEY